MILHTLTLVFLPCSGVFWAVMLVTYVLGYHYTDPDVGEPDKVRIGVRVRVRTRVSATVPLHHPCCIGAL